jgi:hypothetical protein
MTDEVLGNYLDGYSLQRPFDDERQVRIRLEAETMKVHKRS